MSRTYDFLPNTNIKIVQDDEMFRINTDTEVLGNFLEVYKEDICLDMGCNNGALLLYMSRFNPKKLIGLDINPRGLELAKINLDNNNVKNYELINADIKEFTGNQVDVIVCNPPYFKTPNKDFGANDYKAIAKHEVLIDLKSLIASINRNLKDGGTLYFLFLTTRLEEVMNELRKNNLKVKKMQFVYDENKENSNVFMIKAIKNGNVGINVIKPIIKKR